MLTSLANSRNQCGHLVHADRADHKWAAIYPGSPPLPSVLVLPPLLHSPSNCKNTFRIQVKMLPCSLVETFYNTWAKAMNTRITKSYIFCGSLKSGPSHRTKWKKMENLYPFLLRLARKVQFKRRKTENVCPPQCTLEHLIFFFLCWVSHLYLQSWKFSFLSFWL